LTPLQSAALVALTPDLASDAAFGLTFPKGEIAISANTATVLGLEGHDLAVAAGWQGGILEFDRISGVLGGAQLSGKLTVFGTLAKPEMFGSGTVVLAEWSEPALTSFHDMLGTPVPVRDAVGRFLPATLAVSLEAPGGDGGQTIRASGEAGAARIMVEALLGGGVRKATEGTLSATLSMESDEAASPRQG
jgi:hypothetical protein